MAIVKPFSGVRYDLSKVGGDLGQVACPPYDIIHPNRQRAFHEKHPRNFIHLDFGLPSDDADGCDVYARARDLWQQWLQEGVLSSDGTPRYYLYRQTFTATVGGEDACYLRTALVASVHAESFGGSILPHERTLAEPKEDRYRLTMATQAQLDRLGRRTGARFDALFARLMIRHHLGGIAMAREAAERATLLEVRTLATGMERDQLQEVALMRATSG